MKTQFKTIHLEGKVILIDREAEIKKGELCYNTVWEKEIDDFDAFANLGNKAVKVIAATPKLGSLPLLPLPDDEVCFMCDARGQIESDCKSCNGTGKAAKQNSFTKEDMIGFAEWLGNNYNWILCEQKWLSSNEETKTDKTEDLFKLYLNQKPKPQFIPEMEIIVLPSMQTAGLSIMVQQPKIVDGVIQGSWK